MKENIREWNNEKLMKMLKGDSLFNKARQIFSGRSAKIAQAEQQRTPLSPIEMRKMEFEAVQAILAVYGFDET